VCIQEQAYESLLELFTRYWIPNQEPNETFHETKLFHYSKKIVAAIKFLNDQQIYYGDMKPSHVLVFKDQTVKLGDFGTSFKTKESNNYIIGATRDYCMGDIRQ
jgi:serine/threonine protein kinase